MNHCKDKTRLLAREKLADLVSMKIRKHVRNNLTDNLKYLNYFYRGCIFGGK